MSNDPTQPDDGTQESQNADMVLSDTSLSQPEQLMALDSPAQEDTEVVDANARLMDAGQRTTVSEAMMARLACLRRSNW
jgi:hypothetical protein